jgi:hypothetical protein
MGQRSRYPSVPWLAWALLPSASCWPRELWPTGRRLPA